MAETLDYMVVIERGETSFGAWVPDLPGCVAAATSADEALSLIKEAIVLHLDALRADGEDIPEPRSHASVVAVPA